MQAIAPVTDADLLAPGQEMLLRFEIYVAPAWIDLCNLAGENYLESISMSFAGAEMSPNPIAASFSAEINNESAMFHPRHPTSAFTAYFQVGREVRIKLGATYDATDYYWQRIIGYIDTPKFSGDTFKINVSGLDYMQFLTDTKLRKPDNYWGTSVTEITIASEEALGAEKYVGADAMDTLAEENDVVGWEAPVAATFASVGDVGAGSTWAGELTLTGVLGHVIKENIATVIAGERYKFIFWYKKMAGVGNMHVGLYKTATLEQMLVVSGLNSAVWVEEVHYFTATESCNVRMLIRGGLAGSRFRIDEISLKQITGSTNSGYSLPDVCLGPYYATIDGVPFYYRDEGQGWWYDRDNNVFHIENERVVEAGLNLVIHYFTAQSPENVVADLLVTAGLYANQGAALAGMDETPTGITVDIVWFEVGTSCLEAIKMLCERCDYRFYFNYDGTPIFQPFPTAEVAGSEDFAFAGFHVSNLKYYEDRNEIRNRIVIEGKQQSQPLAYEENMPSELNGEANNAASITAYGEHTLSIANHLFQDQASINAMCVTLLARYKDPKWYFAFDTPYNPVPLEIWDTVLWNMILDPADRWGRCYGSFRYGEERYANGATFVAFRGLLRDIKINKFKVHYKFEEVV